MENETGPATKYEVIELGTGIISPVFKYEAGQGTMTVHLEDGTAIVFNSGSSENEQYAIREIGTHSQTDGSGTVSDEGVPTE